MATGKKYYWLKLRETFLTSDAVDFLMSQEDGANYVVLYQMICLKTINTDGRLARQIGEIIIPYDEPKIARDCKWFSIDTVRVALNLYKALGLVYQDEDGVLVLTNHKEMVGSETDWKEQKRIQREKKQLALAEHAESGEVAGCGQVHIGVHTDVLESVHTEIRDKSIENRDKNISSCGELKNSSPPVITFPLIDKTDYEITQEMVNEWISLYPAVDVMQQLRNMKGWLTANPKNRKTRGGINRFVNNWLSKEQNRAPRQSADIGGESSGKWDGFV